MDYMIVHSSVKSSKAGLTHGDIRDHMNKFLGSKYRFPFRLLHAKKNKWDWVWGCMHDTGDPRATSQCLNSIHNYGIYLCVLLAHKSQHPIV